MKTFAFRLDPSLLDRLRKAASQEDTNAGELIRRAVVTELDRLAVTRLARQAEQRGTDAA